MTNGRVRLATKPSGVRGGRLLLRLRGEVGLFQACGASRRSIAILRAAVRIATRGSEVSSETAASRVREAERRGGRGHGRRRAQGAYCAGLSAVMPGPSTFVPSIITVCRSGERERGRASACRRASATSGRRTAIVRAGGRPIPANSLLRHGRPRKAVLRPLLGREVVGLRREALGPAAALIKVAELRFSRISVTRQTTAFLLRLRR